ncbi:hypothetical protein [Corynebacterium senegalense]|uniref:hypothetical protein n=1 Tax=Corynebacterium senegalense TaxID=2080750 RepID=UPI0015F26A03|nr:hypothetical protein [Corynebacterium senegalense]
MPPEAPVLSVRDLALRKGDAPYSFDVHPGLTLLEASRESSAPSPPARRSASRSPGPSPSSPASPATSSAGKLVTMALMSLQLVASNGLYPPEVQPAFIRWVHSSDPMRFSVDLLRHALFGTWDGDPRLWRAVAVLALLAVASWVIAAAGMYKHRVISAKDRHPELSV